MLTLPEKEHLDRLEAMPEQGNHKSAKGPENEKILQKLTEEDARMGSGFPINKEMSKKIVRGELHPFGINMQALINKEGRVVMKNRTVNSLSFKKKKKRSINQRIWVMELVTYVYGFAFLRQVHYILYLRAKYPNRMIQQPKADMTKTYRRCHVWGHIAAACMVLVSSLIFILHWIPFGATLAPLEFCLCSKLAFDLANDLILNKYCNPEETNDPSEDLIPEKDSLRGHLSFEKALELGVEMLPQPDTTVDGYINDVHTVVIDDEKIFKRTKVTLPLALGLLLRKSGMDEPVGREEILQKIKMEGEGTPSELKIFLGWLIDSRLFL
mmetsp:Transcript_10344/g.15391  ORF Transcript_10344/g.15391 Transcript_10344/m.15391 type:complete len:326 (+) Transcript_10344:2871-3848(+)